MKTTNDSYKQVINAFKLAVLQLPQNKYFCKILFNVNCIVQIIIITIIINYNNNNKQSNKRIKT